MAVPPFVDADWVAGRVGELVLADVRWFMDGTNALASFVEGHLPGAVFVDLDRDLAGPPTVEDGRHPLPSPEAFASAMARLGIGDDDVVVAYDQGHGGFAARLAWMLRVTGHAAAVLEGGLGAWPGPLEVGDVAREATTFTSRPWPRARLADLEDVVQASSRGDALVVDARAADRFRGDHEPVDSRAGHVPGAVNLPFMDNLDEAGNLRSDEDLRRHFTAAGVTADRDVIVHCGSGVTACHDLLVMERLGIPGRLHPGSWSQWAGRDDLPVEVGNT